MQSGYVVISNSDNIDRVEENIGSFEFQLEHQDVEAISRLSHDVLAMNDDLINEAIQAYLVGQI